MSPLLRPLPRRCLIFPGYTIEPEKTMKKESLTRPIGRTDKKGTPKLKKNHNLTLLRGEGQPVKNIPEFGSSVAWVTGVGK
jgi:hypothetical protein